MNKILLTLIVILILLLAWYGESRKFFCTDNRCITVWKTYNNTCYIIPGRYYGMFKPAENFLQTTNTNDIIFFFSRDLPKSIIYRSDYPLKVDNKDTNKVIFYEYNSDTVKFDNLLYLPNAKKANDLKEGAAFMDIFIHDNYAIDKNGKNL